MTDTICSQCKKPLTPADKAPWGRGFVHLECKRAYERKAMERYRRRQGVQPAKRFRIEEDGRECARCREFKPWSEFYPDKRAATGYTSKCRECQKAYVSEYQRTEAGKKTLKRSRAKYKYGLTDETFDALLEKQDGKCGVCQIDLRTKSRIAVDHDHACCPGTKTCGKCVRGLLCTHCNRELEWADQHREKIRSYLSSM